METQTAPQAILKGVRQKRAWLTILVVIQLWLFTNGSSVLGRQFPSIPSPTLFYIVFMMWPLIVDKGLLEELLKGTPQEYVVKFALGYLLTLPIYFLVFVTLLKAPPNVLDYSAVWPLFFLQLFFVAPAEELFFRGFVPRLYNPEGKSWKIYAGIASTNTIFTGSFVLADVVTSVTFSGFHYAAYGSNAVFAFIVAFALSIIWTYASRVKVGWPFHANGERREMGIAFTIGSHFAFNMCAFGILTGGVVFGS